MTKSRHEIENWALSVIDRVRRHQPIEDDWVELKTEWPKDPRKAARRIAGHANVAGGEPILWLIGVDEAGMVPGVEYSEFSSWYGGVRASFDELSPEPTTLNVPSEGVTVAAICFDTDRAPYVWKNAEGGTVQREVPWRIGNGVQSATRQQLLRLLSPLQKMPQIEVVRGTLQLASFPPSANQKRNRFWEYRLSLFLNQLSDQQSFITNHRSMLSVRIAGRLALERCGSIGFSSQQSQGVNADVAGISVRGPALFEIHSSFYLMANTEIEAVLGSAAHLEIRLDLATHQKESTVACELAPVRPTNPGQLGNWAVGQMLNSVE